MKARGIWGTLWGKAQIDVYQARRRRFQGGKH